MSAFSVLMFGSRWKIRQPTYNRLVRVWILARVTASAEEICRPVSLPRDSFPVATPLPGVSLPNNSVSTRRTTMATETLYPPKSNPRPSLYRPVNRTAARIFFSSMALLLCVVVFIGFSPTYFRAGMLRAPLPSPILHVHGAIFTLWMLLFLVQAALVSAHRVKWHRSLGTVAFCLPPVMIVLGLIAALDALHRDVQIGRLDPAASFAIPTIG